MFYGMITKLGINGGFPGDQTRPGESSIFVNNTFTKYSGCIFNDNTLSTVRIWNTIMWNNGMASITGLNIPCCFRISSNSLCWKPGYQ